jgi:hypothetical protein
VNLPFNFKGGDSLHPSHPLPKSFFQIQGSTTQRRTEQIKLKSPKREAGTQRGTGRRDAINAYNEMDAISRGVMSFP